MKEKDVVVKVGDRTVNSLDELTVAGASAQDRPGCARSMCSATAQRITLTVKPRSQSPQ